MITIAIDSAMHSVGMALFKDGVLRETELVKVPTKYKGKECVFKMARALSGQVKTWIPLREYKQRPVQLVIEDHEFRYGNEKMKVNTFANMYAVGVCVASAFPFVPAAFYVPKEWKGTVPKAIKTQRIMQVERDLNENLDESLFQNEQDDIVDAIGLGRFHIDKIR